MKKASRVFLFYFLFLLIFSLTFSWLNINSFIIYASTLNILIDPRLLLTVIGGIVALFYLLPNRQFKNFLIIYGCLWVLRFITKYAYDHDVDTIVWNRKFKFGHIIGNYFYFFSQIGTPLPFVIFWMINYLFSAKTKISDNTTKE